MIKKQSTDPNVASAADAANKLITELLAQLPSATSYDYGGHILQLGQYDVCTICTSPIAEAQQAYKALAKKAAELEDSVVAEHLDLAAQLILAEADAAIVRAEFHNGFGTEKILNQLLGFIHDRTIKDSYDHSHQGGQ